MFKRSKGRRLAPAADPAHYYLFWLVFWLLVRLLGVWSGLAVAD
jgi:hypothetical protein